MTLILEIPDELESELAAEASRVGLSLTDYVVDVLSRGNRQSAKDHPINSICEDHAISRVEAQELSALPLAPFPPRRR